MCTKIALVVYHILPLASRLGASLALVSIRTTLCPNCVLHEVSAASPSQERTPAHR